MSKQSIYNADYYRAHRGTILCAQCGYRFEKGDEGYRIAGTGDIIHRDCLMDYTEENINELAEKIEF